MTFHLCCTQPQRTFGFWFRALAAVGSEKLGIWISFLPACNSLRGSGLKVAAERHLSAQNYTLLKHIKSHLVGHSATPPHKHTYTQKSLPRMLLLFRSKVCSTHTHTHTYTMGIILLWLAQLPCAAAIILVSPSPPDPWIPKPRGGPFCMRAGFVYATIEFTASLNLCLSFRFRFHCLLLLLLLPLLVLFCWDFSLECWMLGKWMPKTLAYWPSFWTTTFTTISLAKTISHEWATQWAATPSWWSCPPRPGLPLLRRMCSTLINCFNNCVSVLPVNAFFQPNQPTNHFLSPQDPVVQKDNAITCQGVNFWISAGDESGGYCC